MLAIAWPGGVALVDASVGVGSAERIWSRLHRDSKLGTFLKTLAETSEAGFLDLPPFAVAVADGGRWHIAVRGPVSLEVQLDDRVESLTGEGITTWAERVLASPQGVRLGAEPGAGPSGPIMDGVVPAGGIHFGEFASGPHPEGRLRAEPVSSPVEAPRSEDAVGEQAAPPVSRDRDPEVSMAGPQPEASEPAPAPSELTAAQETLAEDDLVVPVVATQEENKYASLWDHSIALDVEAAAIRPEAEEASAVAVAPVDLLGGDTVVDEGVVEVQMVAPASAGPQVLARFCDRGHANPPERATCFVCGSEVAGEARRAPRPQLGWLRIEGGETIPLRGPIIAGRNPQSNVLKLDETPRLVALPHPHVSGTHLAILIEGWRVLARDLRSSNGTYLRRHGKPPVRLPETPVPLVPGDLIDLGKGLYIHLDRTP